MAAWLEGCRYTTRSCFALKDLCCASQSANRLTPVIAMMAMRAHRLWHSSTPGTPFGLGPGLWVAAIEVPMCGPGRPIERLTNDHVAAPLYPLQDVLEGFVVFRRHSASHPHDILAFGCSGVTVTSKFVVLAVWVCHPERMTDFVAGAALPR